MSAYLDLATWPRREAFEYFRGFAHPHFNTCVHLDAAALKAAVKARGQSFALACHFLALRLAQQQACMRYRMEGERVRVVDTVHGSSTVLREDGSFGFVILEQQAVWSLFHAQGQAAMAASRAREPGSGEAADEDALMHFTTIPWLHFHSFSHPRKGAVGDSIPKLAFGQIRGDGSRLWLPISLEVHHALMDGLHVGQYLQALQAAMLHPGEWLGTD